MAKGQKQFEETWKSFEWLIRDRLIKIDEIARHMVLEMQILGVPNDYIAEQLPLRFRDLQARIVAENNERFIQESYLERAQKRRAVSNG